MMKNDIKKKNPSSPSIPIGLLLLGMMGVSTQTRAVEAREEDVLTTMKNMKRDEDPRADENNGQAKREKILGRVERNKILAIAEKCRLTHEERLQDAINLIPDGEANLPLKNTKAYRDEFNSDWDQYRASIKQAMKIMDDVIKRLPALTDLLDAKWVGDKRHLDYILHSSDLQKIKEYKDQAEGVYDLLTITKKNALGRIPLYRLAPLWKKVDLGMLDNFALNLHNVHRLLSHVERQIRLNSRLSSQELLEALEDFQVRISNLSLAGEKVDYDAIGIYYNTWDKIMSLIRFSEKSKNEIQKELSGTNSSDETLAFWN